MSDHILCIIKPNRTSFSETFINEHINRLSGNKRVLDGGAFPLFDHEGNYLIKSRIGMLSYLIQKRIFKRKNIKVRTKVLVNYLVREKVDVVLAEYGMVGAMVTEACKQADVPLVVHFHGADAHHRKTVQTYLPYYRRMFDYASGIAAVSLDMIDELARLGAPAKKIKFISCGVDTSKFNKVEIKENRNFLSVGRFVAKKAPIILIEAFSKVTLSLPETKLHMVGDGPLFDEAKARIDHLDLSGKVILHGVLKQDEIRRLFQDSFCFVQHSIQAADGDMEGTPVTILEAGASGLPVVSTRHAGIKQAVLDGDSGFLVDEQDVDGATNRMIQIGKMTIEELSKIGDEGSKHILNNYNIEGQIRKLDELIKSALVKTKS